MHLTSPRGVRLGPGRNALSPDQILIGFPGSNDRELCPSDHDLRDARARIVVGRHRKAVSAGAEYRQQSPRLTYGHGSVLGEEVTALANRPDHIDAGLGLTIGLLHNRPN